jgi:hypothetical protein
MSIAMPVETTFVSPDASMFARSLTFNAACAAVGVHTPAEQLMFVVGVVEITMAACAAAPEAAEMSKAKCKARCVARAPRANALKRMNFAPSEEQPD